ncbi:hypothetical protein I541_5647 [Mycobacteroides abscessus]|nr:hypothetical protein I541_5647 [Mycobacteroides abscessus]
MGITRPDGNKLTQATLAWQDRVYGEPRSTRRVVRSNADLRPQLERMSKLADVMSAMTNELGDGDPARLQQMMPQTLAMAKELEGQLDRLSVADIADGHGGRHGGSAGHDGSLGGGHLHRARRRAVAGPRRWPNPPSARYNPTA